jgi:hypothetical protein
MRGRLALKDRSIRNLKTNKERKEDGRSFGIILPRIYRQCNFGRFAITIDDYGKLKSISLLKGPLFCMKTFRLLFLAFVTLLSLFVSITGLLAEADVISRILQVIFFPVTLYLVFILAAHILKKTPFLNQKAGLGRALVYYCFVVTTAVVSIGFLSSKNFPQLVTSLIFSPMAIYFLLLVLPHRKVALPLIKNKPDAKAVLATATKLDVNRRDFLKLLGSAGIMAVIFGLFGRRSTGIPFLSNTGGSQSVSLMNASGNVVNPAENSPTGGYNIAQIDDSTPAYFGFVNKDGAWFIMREGEDDAFRYIKGDNNFSASWEKRAKLDYSYFDKVF